MKLTNHYTYLILITLIINTYSQRLRPCLPAHKCELLSDQEINNYEEKCSSHGKCFYDIFSYFQSNKTIPFKSCVCDRGWTDDPYNSDVKCCYKRKSQFVAFALETFVGFGVGHFYIENDFVGMIKMLLCITLCCSCCLISVCFCYKEDPNTLIGENRGRRVYREHLNMSSRYPLKYKLFNFFLIFSCCSIVLWQLIDAILFGINFYSDGNGIRLEPW